MDNKSCIAFVLVVSLLFAAAGVICPRNHPFQGQHLSNAELRFSKDTLINTKDDYDEWRIGINDCSKENIAISQGQTTPLPSGIPTYTVIITNICLHMSSTNDDNCMISELHLSCGWFSSARLINPNMFRRISYDDCLVNNGNPIPPGQTISFQYANTYPYPMSVSSLQCN